MYRGCRPYPNHPQPLTCAAIGAASHILAGQYGSREQEETVSTVRSTRGFQPRHSRPAHGMTLVSRKRSMSANVERYCRH